MQWKHKKIRTHIQVRPHARMAIFQHSVEPPTQSHRGVRRPWKYIQLSNANEVSSKIFKLTICEAQSYDQDCLFLSSPQVCVISLLSHKSLQCLHLADLAGSKTWPWVPVWVLPGHKWWKRHKYAILHHASQGQRGHILYPLWHVRWSDAGATLWESCQDISPGLEFSSEMVFPPEFPPENSRIRW